uniref:Uncharacterized protein n=1 Tax=Euplotes harpa TaxID=151035 RepID=A0A7S3J8N5_9SPIT|mmetsp:Transcript_26106/g.30136  ORF Transcript_26106/g.30136 Transcript_26106/m.30136 type:complete len:113 (+) Transcript_26106:194-532(+)
MKNSASNTSSSLFGVGTFSHSQYLDAGYEVPSAIKPWLNESANNTNKLAKTDSKVLTKNQQPKEIPSRDCNEYKNPIESFNQTVETPLTSDREQRFSTLASEANVHASPPDA